MNSNRRTAKRRTRQTTRHTADAQKAEPSTLYSTRRGQGGGDNIAPNEIGPRRQTKSDAERNDTNPQAHNITDTCYSLTLSQTTVTLGVSLGNWAARATDGLSFDARIMRTSNPAAAPDDPRTQDQRDITRCRVECD